MTKPTIGHWSATTGRAPSEARPSHGGQPRLAGRDVVVPHDLGVRVPPPLRALLDRLRDRFDLDEAEVARTLLAAGMFAGKPLRDRVAAALYASGSMHLHAELARLAARMRTPLACSSPAIARTTPPSPPRAPPATRTAIERETGMALDRIGPAP